MQIGILLHRLRGLVPGLFSLLLCLSPVLAQTIRYVRPAATGTGTGASWANASGNLQAMIDASASNDQVWVAAGIYRPGTTRASSFTIKTSVQVYGGFAGTETALTQRPAITLTNPSNSTLSGDIGTVGNTSDNSYHVVWFQQSTNITRLDGFVITGGNANGTGQDANGGGLYNNPRSGNFSASSQPIVAFCWVAGNVASERGGGVFNPGGQTGGGRIRIETTVFTSNTATYGGAVCVEGLSGNSTVFTATVNLMNCLLFGNRATQQGGGIYSDSGSNGTTNALFTNCTMSGNVAANGAHELHTNGFGTSTRFTNSVVWNPNGTAITGLISTPGPLSLYYSLVSSNISIGINDNSIGHVFTNISPFVDGAANNFRLACGSPGVNAGDPGSTSFSPALPTIDIAGQTRIQGDRVEMGAFENPTITFTTQPVATTAVCRNSPVMASVAASNNSGGGVTYQWFWEGGYSSATSVVGQTSATLNLTAVQLAQAGRYWAVATTNLPYCTQAVSSTVTLRVIGPIVYVTPTGGGTQNGDTPNDPISKVDFPSVLASACASTTFLVAAGLYKPTQGTDRNASFVIPSGVQVYGSFNFYTNKQSLITPESAPTTVFIGLLREVAIGNPIPVYAYHVVRFNGVDANTRLDGVWITNGFANGGGDNDYGAGIFNNGRGAGQRSNPVVANCLFSSNRSGFSGAGIYNSGTGNGNASPTLINCLFVANETQYGGAVFNDGLWAGSTSSPTLINCLFYNNIATQRGGGMYNDAGGGGNSRPTLINCTLSNNSAGNGGSEIYNSDARPTLINTIVWNATQGGNSMVSTSAVTAHYSLFNSAVSNYSGTGNLTVNPVFVSEAQSNYRLVATSSALNAGNPASSSVGSGTNAIGSPDLAGQARISFGRIDMGAFERTGNITSVSVIATSVVCTGQFFSLSASVVGGAVPYSYTWTMPTGVEQATGNGTPVFTAKSSLAGVRTFTLTVADAGGSRLTTTASLTVRLSTALIISPPAVVTACQGGSVSIPLTATGTAPLTYQWYRNGQQPGNALSGQTSAPGTPAALTLSNLQPADAGVYRCLITGGCNNVWTEPTVVSLPGLPQITRQPNPVSVAPLGTTSIFSVQATSTQPIRYQWFRLTRAALSPVASQTNATMILSGIQSNMGGIYVCQLQTSCGSLFTTDALLRVGSGPLHISVVGAGNRTGFDWANALPGSVLPLAAAFSPTNTSILVAGGSYRPVSVTTTATDSERQMSFRIGSGVQVYGGYDATTGNRPSRPSSTTLSGEIGLPGMADNSYRVVTFSGASTQTRLDGVVISDGNANSLQPPFDCGGGIYNDARQATSSPTLVNCHIVGNAARFGGGFYNDAFNSIGNPTLTNCLIRSNTAQFNGGGFYNGTYTGTSSPALTSCTLTSNTAGSGGGAFYNDAYTGTSQPALTNCFLTDNVANDGGGLYQRKFQGGANVTLTNCLLAGNRAASGGGAIAAYNDGPALTNNTLARNSATNGAGSMRLVRFGAGSQANLTSSLFFGNGTAGATISTAGSATAQVRYSLFETGTTGYSAGLGVLTASTSPFADLTTDLRLRPGSPAINTGDPAATTATLGTFDLAGTARILDGRVDMGAYETLNCTELVSIRTGDWNDPGTWSCNRIPQAGDAVRLRHAVTIPDTVLATVTFVRYDAGGRLLFGGTGARLRFGN